MTAKPSLLSKRYDLGQQPGGTIVEVVLSCINNIRLMDHDNFTLYNDSKNCRFIGGRTEKSPARLTIPKAGHWHVVVDKTGFETLANSNVRAIPPKAMNPANSATAKEDVAGSRSA